MKSFDPTVFIQATLQLVYIIAAFIKADHVAKSGTTSVFAHLETYHNETLANGRENTNTSLALETVATAILLPIRNELLATESSVESNATKTAESTITEEVLAQPQQPSVDQGINKLKVEEGKSVVLPCWYHNDGAYLDKVSVSWYREQLSEKLPVVRDNTAASGNYSGRVFLNGHLSNGDASMTILNATKSDDGTYFCTIMLANGTILTGDGTHLIVKSKTEFLVLKKP
ncbi:uncharacterized protein LOC121283941 [Carcharodon carcharias]|uniref:uncharacterized protein LOC121283941 n=1 Tax=Carcharodon carcharias TaxID=13397 RepID=UPI001B7E0E0C|nr:uncharacterized protein LOC121283941 [Carcharodon carcharias]